MTSSNSRSNQLLLSARLRNFLSYGPESEEIELKPLNVFIGPNGSGKSNFIEALSLLNAAPDDIVTPIRQGGGTREWIWKGEYQGSADLEFRVNYPQGRTPLRYRLEFESVAQRFEIKDEVIENSEKLDFTREDVFFYYRYQMGRPVLSTWPNEDEVNGVRQNRRLQQEEIEPGQSILSQKKDSYQYPEITYLGKQFEGVRIYRDWDFGRHSTMRAAVIPDLPNDFLLPDASNLNLIMNKFEELGVREDIDRHLSKYLGTYMGYHTGLESGTVQLFLKERGLRALVPASRLSDGTIRFLCLLAVLCHPTPPPLVCIEEPELCQHPDMLPTIADLLVEASSRTQIIVTTHSDILVDSLTESPDSVIVCDKTEQGTSLRRLDAPELKEWLTEYGGLGELWRRGHLGGNRW